jgi:hypothetical protein
MSSTQVQPQPAGPEQAEQSPPPTELLAKRETGGKLVGIAESLIQKAPTYIPDSVHKTRDGEKCSVRETMWLPAGKEGLEGARFAVRQRNHRGYQDPTMNMDRSNLLADYQLLVSYGDNTWPTKNQVF